MRKFFYLIVFGSVQLIAQELDSLLNVASAADSSEQVKLYDQISDQYFLSGNYGKALEYRYLVIRDKERRNDTLGLADDWFEVGRCHYYMRNENNSNDQALKFLRQSFAMARRLGDTTTLYRAGRGIGAILGEIRKYDSAFFYLEASMKIAEDRSDFSAVSGLMIIKGTYIMERDSNLAETEKYFNKALLFAKQSDDIEAYAYALHTLGGLKHRQGKYEEAVMYIEEANEIQTDLGSMDGMLNTLAALSNAYRKLGDAEKLFEVMDRYLIYKDSIYNRSTFEAITEVQTKYETEKKEQAIASLETEALLKDQVIERNTYLMVMMGALALFAGAFLWMNFRKRNYKLKAKLAEDREQLQRMRFAAVIAAEEKERKRIAQELHDGLGQLLSAARMSISSLDEDEQNKKIQNSMRLVDQAVQEVRSVSHNLMPRALTKMGLVSAIRDQVHQVNESGLVRVKFNAPEEPIMDESIKVAIYRIVQELLNNALKYAEAEQISIQLESVGNFLSLTVEDNGVGFDISSQSDSNGIGWQNIQSRVELIGGTIKLESRKSQGTKVQVRASKIKGPEITNFRA